VPEHFETSAAPAAPAAADGALARLWHGVKTALANIFALRRSDAPRPRLLAAEEEALVAQILQLKLEGARLALLAGDGRTFGELLVAARAWLDQYYDETDPAVRAAVAELERLRAMNLAPPLPDISRSLAQLRTVAGAASR
jgi:uroporphyrin-3 C-methyltransferase